MDNTVSFYKLKSSMGEFFRSNIKITMHLFDTLVKPILMYMSDFWGGLKVPDDRHNPIEKLHYMACKQFLGVQKETTNIGVLLELGRIPLRNFIIKSAIKNWERIKSGDANSLIVDSYKDASKEGLPWISGVEEHLERNSLHYLFTNMFPNRFPFIHRKLHKAMIDQFNSDALSSIRNPDNKLKTYGLFKLEKKGEGTNT